MTDPAWQQLHAAWWEEQRDPQPGDVEAAWAALWDVVPAGWTVTRPQFDPGARLWKCSAVGMPGSARKGGAQVVSAAGPTEPAVLVELARCLVVMVGGGVPR